MKTFFPIILLSLVSFSGCKNPSDKINEDLDKNLEEIKRQNEKNDLLIQEIEKQLAKGGQPGKITVSGAIVKDSQLDARITVVANTGTGKDGVQAEILEAAKPIFLEKNEKLDLSKIADAKNLIGIGCEGSYLNELAQERDLELQPAPAEVTSDVMIVQAKMVVLCGSLESLKKYQFLTVSADELILSLVNYDLFGTIGSVILNSNKLVLVGENKLVVQQMSLATNYVALSSIELNVLKEISSEKGGKILLMSQGSNSIPK